MKVMRAPVERELFPMEVVLDQKALDCLVVDYMMVLHHLEELLEVLSEK